MTTDNVDFRAPCDLCGADALWQETRGGSLQEGAPAMTVLCPACGDSDPVRRLQAMLTKKASA